MRLHLLFAVAVCLAPTSLAQQTLTFTINEPASTWNWSGQVTVPPSLGSLTLPIVGNPSNATVNPFQLFGTILVVVQGGSTLTAAQFVGGTAEPRNGIHGKVNNPIPFQPALGTFDIGEPAPPLPSNPNAVAGLDSAAFPIAGDQSFSASMRLVYSQGNLHIIVQGYPTIEYSFGTAMPPDNQSSFSAFNGTLVRTATGLTLNASVSSATPLRLSFQRDIDPGPGVQNVTGFFDFWGTLVANYTFTPTGSAFCSGDGSGTACPCGNAGSAGRGCANSTAGNMGAVISGLGVPSIGTDLFTLTATDITGPGLFFQGSGQWVGGAGLAFGDGLFCAGGTITRMGVVFPTGVSATYPGGLTPSPIHLAGGVAAPGLYHYQCWYRDSVAFCSAATYNLTQGLSVTWLP